MGKLFIAAAACALAFAAGAQAMPQPEPQAVVVPAKVEPVTAAANRSARRLANAVDTHGQILAEFLAANLECRA